MRPPIQVTRRTPQRVACAVFACRGCNWPLVGAKFSSRTADDFHEEVFEVGCTECGTQGAVLGRDAVDRLIVSWTDRKITRLIRGA
jgi:RNase P subunit RPR2